jgi:bifunctional non-homologous end joining protein LigD
MAAPKKPAVFVEPMECLPVSKLPEGPQWVYEIKLDGYRAVAVKSGITNRSTRDFHL